MKTLLLLPLPPPAAGPEIVAAAMVETLPDAAREQTLVVNATVRRVNRAKGKLDLAGLRGVFRVYRRLVRSLFQCDTLFMHFCSARFGFLRDALYIFTARLMRRRVVGQYHGGNFRRFYELRSGFYRRFIRFTLRRLSRVLVLGESLKEMFEEIYPLSQVEVLHNGVQPEEYPSIKRGPREPFTLLYIGHLTFPKGFYDLIWAYKQLRLEYGSNIRLLFAGERIGRKPALANFLDERWGHYYLENIDTITRTIDEFVDGARRYNAEYLGVIDHDAKLSALTMADLFVLPSYTEGLSMSCLEAMAAGLPVVCTPVGAMKDVIVSGQGGLLPPVGDQAQLAETIRKMLHDQEASLAMGRFNRTRIETDFHIDTVANKLVHILDSLE